MREDQEARVAAVQEAEAVAAGLHLEVGPRVAVDHHRVAEELRVPDRADVARPGRTPASGMKGIWSCVRRPSPSKNARLIGEEERAVRVERAVLDGDRDLVVLRSRRIAGAGRGTGQRAADLVAAARRAGGRSRPARRRRSARVMPSVWSWYQSVVASWSLGYCATCEPGRPRLRRTWPRTCALKWLYHVPSVA